MKKILILSLVIIIALSSICIWQHVSYKNDVSKLKYTDIIRDITFYCGEVADISIGLLNKLGYDARLVAALTEEEWDNVSDGHTMFEIYVNDKWVLCDMTYGVLYQKEDEYLSLYEVIKTFKNDVSDIKIVSLWTYLPQRDYPLNLMKRIFQAPLIYDGGYWYTPSQIAIKHANDYVYIEYDNWLLAFYRIKNKT